MATFLTKVFHSVMEFTDSILLDPEMHKHRFTKVVLGLFSAALELELLETNLNQFKMTTQYFGPFYRSKNIYNF